MEANLKTVKAPPPKAAEGLLSPLSEARRGFRVAEGQISAYLAGVRASDRTADTFASFLHSDL